MGQVLDTELKARSGIQVSGGERRQEHSERVGSDPQGGGERFR